MSERARSIAERGRTCHALLRDVHQLRHGWRLQVLLGAAALSLLVAEVIMALLLAASSLDDGVAGGLWVGLGVAALGGLICGGTLLQRLLDAPLPDALWAARRAGNERIAEQLRTALELADATTSTAWGSPRLIEASVDIARPHLSELKRAIDELRRGNRWLLLCVVALGAAHLGSTFIAPDPWRALLSRPQAGAMTGPLVVGTLVGDLHLRVHPPTYAQDAIATREVESAEDTVLRGSSLEFRARPLPGYAQLIVEIDRGAPEIDHDADHETRSIDTARSPDDTLSWRQLANETLRYRYAGQTQHGREVHEQSWREIKVQRDAPPSATLNAPVRELEVHTGDHVVIEGQAEDDIGISGVELLVALPSGELDRRTMAFQPGDKRVELRESIDVDKLSLRPGEFASLHIEAADNNALDGVQRAASAQVLLRMFSAARYHARLLDLMAEVTLTWTLRLAERLERDPARNEMNLRDALHNRADLATAEKRALNELTHLLSSLSKDVLSGAHTALDLQEIERLLRERLANEDRNIARISLNSNQPRQQRHLYAIARHHAKMVLIQERAVLLLATLAVAEHHDAMMREGRGLQSIEQKLIEAVKNLAGQPSDVQRAEAQRLLDAVQGQIERMLQSAAKQLRIAPIEHFNPAALTPDSLHQTMHEQRDALREVRELIATGEASKALATLQRVREATEALMTRLQADAEKRRTGEDAALERMIKRLRRGINQARRSQSELREALRPAAEAQARTSAMQLQRNLKTVLHQAQALLNDARDQIRPQRLKTPQMRVSRAIASARAALSSTRTALKNRALGSALQSLSEADERIAAARRELTPLPQAADLQTELRSSDLRRLRQAADRAARAATLLRQALPSLRDALSPQARQQLHVKRRRQEKIAHRFHKVRKRLSRVGERHPGLENQVGARLDHALQMMRQSAGSLQSADASRAFEQMAETLSALQRAQDLLQEDSSHTPALVPASSHSLQQQSSREKVKVRPGNSNDGRDTFREQVLDAMRQDSPSRYRARLRRYFEEIVK